MATIQLNSGLIIACSVLFIPASSVLMGLRFYTRKRQKVSLGIDDWLMVPAFILLLSMQVTMIVEVCKRMIGYADPNFVPGKADASSNLAFWPFELEQIPVLSLIKLSVIFFYRRVFNTGATPLWHWSTMTMIGFITAWTISFFFSFVFICDKTPEDYWLSVVTEKSGCVATQELHLAFSVSDTILDILIILMAVPMIWSLHMTAGRKLAVLGIFSLGMITVAASIARMVIFMSATALRYDPYLDFEYLITSGIYWSMLECGLAFIAANLVIVYGLFASIKPFSSIMQSLRGLLSSKLSWISSRNESLPDQVNNDKIWPRVMSSAEYAGSYSEHAPLSNGIRMKREFESSIEMV